MKFARYLEDTHVCRQIVSSRYHRINDRDLPSPRPRNGNGRICEPQKPGALHSEDGLLMWLP